MSQYITKTNISNPKNLIIAGKDNVYTQKKRNRSLSDKKAYFKVEKNSVLHKMQSSHDSVLSGINWKQIKALIPTKITAEIKSFAKYFFYKMKSCKDDNLGIDFTSNSINNLKDMLFQIKSKYPNIIDCISILKKLTNKYVKIRKYNKKILKKNMKNGEKNELNKLKEEKHNYINNNLFSNLNSHYLNDICKNRINHQDSNNINDNVSNDNKIIVFNTNVVDNNFINQNINNCINLLNNFLNCNIENLLLSEYISDLNGKLLNHYKLLNINNNIYINYLYRINNLLSSKVQQLNSISFISNIFIYNLLKQLNSFSHIPLIGNNYSLINNKANLPNNMGNLINYISQINQVKYNNNS